MPGRKNTLKRNTLSIRVTPYVKRLIEDVAYMEGLTASEWVRMIIVRELKNRGVLKAIPLEEQFEESG